MTTSTTCGPTTAGPQETQASACDIAGLPPRTRFLILVAAAIAPWSLVFSVALALR